MIKGEFTLLGEKDNSYVENIKTENNSEPDMGYKKESLREKRIQEQAKRLKGLHSSLKNESSDGEISIVNKYQGKPGLDIEEGRYRVAGTVTASSIFTRKGPKTNIALSCGYCIEEIDTGKRLLMTKEEGVQIASQYGLRNGYIVYRKQVKKDKEGRPIKEEKTIYLQPYPAKKESFTQDDRLITMFSMDEDGRIKHPVELQIKQEDCTPAFWIYVKQIYEKKRKTSKNKKRERGVEEKQRQKILELEAEIGKHIISNPFDEN